MKSVKVEVCCGGLGDALAAGRFPIARIELNSALELGGLTPSLSTLREVKKNVSVPVMTMVRPRGAGFCYSLQEKQIMFLDAEVFHLWTMTPQYIIEKFGYVFYVGNEWDDTQVCALNAVPKTHYYNAMVDRIIAP